MQHPKYAISSYIHTQIMPAVFTFDIFDAISPYRQEGKNLDIVASCMFSRRNVNKHILVYERYLGPALNFSRNELDTMNIFFIREENCHLHHLCTCLEHNYITVHQY